MRKNINLIQEEHAGWADKNFPDATVQDALLGVAEEVGELAHAVLKEKQGIRGNSKVDWNSEKYDAIGDIMLYLMHICTLMGWEMEWLLSDVWNDVKDRDWKANPDTGTPTIGPPDPPDPPDLHDHYEAQEHYEAARRRTASEPPIKFLSGFNVDWKDLAARMGFCDGLCGRTECDRHPEYSG